MSITVSDALAYAGLRLIDLIALVLSKVILLTAYAFANYPNASTLALSLVFVYIIYKTLRRMVKFWLGIFLFFFKFTMYVLIVLTLLAVYVRGFKRFFTKDLIYLKDLLTSNLQASDDYFKQGAYQFMKDDKFDFLQSARDFLENSKFEIDESYFDQENYQNLVDNLANFWGQN